jgi:peptidoglycan-N-acetylglucosamine deacetylase
MKTLILTNLSISIQKSFFEHFTFNLQIPPMRNYLVKTPRLLKAIYSSCIWHVNNNANSVYLTFDDGPHPTITPHVLDVLKQYNAKATFFCIGKNVEEHPEIYQRILNEGHAIGNHTQNHFNGWKVDSRTYINNIVEAAKHIRSNLFRPPYGRITASEIRELYKQNPEMKIVMWDVLSGDFDENLAPEQCLKHAVNSTKPGSIIVFHDSRKAFKRLDYALPRFLKHCQINGWQMKKLNF